MMAYFKQGLISQRRGSSFYFYHYDGLGSTKALTDANQNSQASYIYDAWGNVLQSSGTIINPYLYVGELGYYADGNASMYLLTQRWYNPVVGRFNRPDKIKGSETSNLYLYVEDDPLGYVDPSGLQRCPSWSELPKDMKNTVPKCFEQSFKTGWVWVPQGGYWTPYYYFDYEGFKGCLKGKVKDTALDWACCWWYSGTHDNPYPWNMHPCSPQWYGREAVHCQSCCDFKHCKCLLSSKSTGSAAACKLKLDKCYTSCDACVRPAY